MRSPPHAGARPSAQSAQGDDRARQHAQPGNVAHAPRDGDEPAAQAGADLIAGVAVHEDLPAAHPGALALPGRAEVVAGGALDDEPAAAHAHAGEVVHGALDDELASAHARAGVHARVARDRQPAGGHACTQELDAAQVALDAQVLAALSRHREEVPDLRRPVAVPDGERLDLAALAGRETIRAEAFGLQRHRRLLAQRQRQH